MGGGGGGGVIGEMGWWEMPTSGAPSDLSHK